MNDGPMRQSNHRGGFKYQSEPTNPTERPEERRARVSFWLDGGYDVDAVLACPYSPEHRWWEFRVGDVVENCYDPDERMVICRGCYVPRCGHTTDTDPCVRPRHHEIEHVYESGRREAMPV